MSNLFYDKEEQDSLLIPVEDEQYTVVTGTNEESVMTIDNSQQQDSILVPAATQSVILMETGTTTPKPSVPVGDYVTLDTEQTITGNKDFAGNLTFHGVTVATLDDIDLSNLVDLTSQQTISGLKIFEDQIGIINSSDGDINLIKHINNNFLITENNGTNILNIDEQLQAMYLYNKKIATEEYVNEKAMEGGSGTVVNVGGVEVGTLNFTSDPQTQIDNISDNLPQNVSDLTNDAGFITKSVDNLDNYYDKNYIDNNYYDKTEVDQRIPTALSHLTNDIGFIDNSVSDLLNYYTKTQTDALLLHKVDKTTLNDYYKSTDVDNLLSNKVDTTTLTTNYYNKTQTDNLLNTKASTSSVTNAITESKGYTDTKISELIGGAPETLNTLKEIADAFAEDQEVLDALETAIGIKVDKVEGKGLSSNDYTDAEKTKLASLSNYDDTAIYAEVNKKANKSELDNYYKKTETYDVVEIDGLLNSKANQSDLDTTNANVSQNTKDIQGLSTFYTELDAKVEANKTSISSLDTNKADKTDVQTKYNNLSNNKADKTELESAVTTLNETIDDVRELIGESQGTVVKFGETPQAEIIFTSNPQDQIDALNEKTDDLVGKIYYVDGRAEGEIFNDYNSNVASGVYSHAEGGQTDATADYAHAEGFNSIASGAKSHAEGTSIASGDSSHSEGYSTTASGDYSHSEGRSTTASHSASHASGFSTKTGRDYQTVVGTRNVGKADTLFEVGNGYFDDVTGNTINQNAFEVQEDGTLYIQNGTLTDGTNNVTIDNIATKDEIPDISTKADKVSGATANNLASLDANGILLDSGISKTQIETNTTKINQIANNNLLINGDFKINQRGKTSYSGSEYCVDRWQNSAYGVITPNSNGGITIKGNGGTVYFCQRIEESSTLVGKTVTFSICLEDGTVYSATDTLQATAGSYAIKGFTGGQIRIYYYASTGYFGATLDVYNGYTITVKWIKLEIGDIATPYVPRPYAEEFAMCQRYYEKGVPYSVVKFARSTNVFYDGGYIPLKVQKRTTPTVSVYSISGAKNYIRNDNGSTDVALNYGNITTNGFRIYSNAGGLTQDRLAYGYYEADAEIQ